MTAEASDAAFSAKTAPLEGTQLVEAGAGTGKTHAIVDLFERLLLERELDVSQILVVTYTVAATAELRRRIRERLVDRSLAWGPDDPRSAPIADALRGFDRAAIFTIHGFCQRVLRERAFESGSSFESELVSDADALLEEVAQDFWVRELRGAPLSWTRELVRWQWLPARLAVLAAQVAARPDLVLRPPRPTGVDLDGAEARWRDAQRAVGEAWRRGGAEALAGLEAAVAAGELHGSRYKPEFFECMRSALERELDEEDPLRCLSERVPRFPLLEQSRIERDTKKAFTPVADPFFEACDALKLAREAREEAFRQGLLVLLHDFVDYARDELSRRKAERDLLFFDDLLLRLGDALGGEGGDDLAAAVRRRYPAAMIDEFQDTDPVQYGVFRRIWANDEGSTLFLIGDPKQAIYAFRGADVFAYLAARGDVDRARPLTTNWRSDPALLDGLNAVFGAGPRPFVYEDIAYEPAVPQSEAADHLEGERIRSGLRVLNLEPPAGGKLSNDWRGPRLARKVAGEIARVLAAKHEVEGRPLAPGDVAVLTRTNRQAREMQEALRALGIAGVLQSEESVYETEEAAELERVLRAVVDPDDPSRVRAAVATTLFSRTATECLGVSEDEGEEEAWEEWGGLLRDARRIWADHGLPRALRHLWTSRGVVERLLARPDGERRVTNLHHLIELLHREAAEARLGPLALLYWLTRRRAEALARGRWVAEEAQLRLESDAAAVQLLTVHRAKGLQFRVTFCPFLWDGTGVRQSDPLWRYHDPESKELVVEVRSPKGLATDAAEALATDEAFAENLRVAYVGLTRARHHCSVVWGGFKGFRSSPLRHFVLPDAEKPEADEVRAAYAETAAATGGALRVEPLDPAPFRRPAGAGAAAGAGEPALASRVALRSFRPWWRVSSFSALVAFADDAAAEQRPELEEGRDYDARTEEAGGAEPPADDDAQVRLAAFPAGAMPGILIHEIFEEADFRDTGGLDALVAAKLRGRNLPLRFAAPLAEAVREVLSVPLDPGDPESALAALSRADRIDEMPFTLPVATREGGDRPLTPERLAAAFEAHAESDVARAWAARAARLGFTPLAGHLRGFVDLVFRRGSRWFLLDYKSNHLGARPVDYGPGPMKSSMLEHDYVLQYHLYCVALHRHLQQRLPGYDYDEHMGGAYYLFVRGMAPRHPDGTGVLFDRPSRALVEALSEMLS